MLGSPFFTHQHILISEETPYFSHFSENVWNVWYVPFMRYSPKCSELLIKVVKGRRSDCLPDFQLDVFYFTWKVKDTPKNRGPIQWETKTIMVTVSLCTQWTYFMSPDASMIRTIGVIQLKLWITNMLRMTLHHVFVLKTSNWKPDIGTPLTYMLRCDW